MSKYKPVPWHLRKRRAKHTGVRVTEIQSLTTGDIIKEGNATVSDELGDWVDDNWGATPKAPKREKGLGDARYYVSATQGSVGWNPAFEGFGVFDAQNNEYCVYASYTLGHAERRCKLMNAVDSGELSRYALIKDPKRELWHIVDIYHEKRWAWTGSRAECEALASKLNGRKQ